MAGSQVRASQQLRVTNTIMHGGSYPKGYRVINKSQKATVWVSQNPGMTPGTGTVVYPGTSISWQVDGDLFLILGDDTRSTDVGFADITLSYDVGDWQPDPVAIASAAINRQQLLSNLSLSVGGNSIGPTIDASLFNSLVISVLPPSVATAKMTFDVIFFQSITDANNFTNPFWTYEWTWYDTTAVSGLMLVQVPVRSPYVRYQTAGTGGPAFTIKTALSSQFVQNVVYDVNRFGFIDGVLLDFNSATDGTIAVGPGTVKSKLTQYPYTGDVDIWAEIDFGVALGAGVTVGWLALFDSNTVAIANRIALLPFVANPMAANGVAMLENPDGKPIRMALPGCQTLFQMNNSVGAVANYRVLVTAANSSSRW